jgi:hypothetical protein
MQKKKILSIEIHTDKLSGEVRETAIRLLVAIANDKALAANAEVLRENEYLHVNFECFDVKSLWAAIYQRFISEDRKIEGLADKMIVVCQGDHDWDDYLLLYHYDPTEQIDQIER